MVKKKKTKMKYLVCLDGSDSANKALDLVIKIAKPEDIIHLFTVVDGYEDQTKRVDELLDVSQKKCNDSNLQSILLWAVGHDPKLMILESAKNHSIDLILLGRHGHNVLERFVFGTTGDYVVKNATCPVLCV